MKRKKEIDPKTILADLHVWVNQYRAASAALEGSADTFIARAQNHGLLVELAIKTYLAACDVYEKGHDLLKLTRLAEESGLTVSSDDRTNVIEKLQQYYFLHDGLDWNFLTRYPVPNRPTTVWLTPSHAQVDSMVQLIIDQARAKQSD